MKAGHALLQICNLLLMLLDLSIMCLVEACKIDSRREGLGREGFCPGVSNLQDVDLLGRVCSVKLNPGPKGRFLHTSNDRVEKLLVVRDLLCNNSLPIERPSEFRKHCGGSKTHA